MRKTKFDEKLESLGYLRMPTISDRKSYCLYKSETKRFEAVFKLDRSGKIIFNGETYKTVEEFLEAVDRYNHTLYFNPDTYNPDYRKEWVDEARLHETFSKCGLSDTDRFYRKGYFFGDDVGGRFAEVQGGDLMLSETSWIPLLGKDDAVDERSCTRIKSMLAAVYATHIACLCGTLSDMGKLSFVDTIEVKTFNDKTMKVETKDGKEGIIAKLEEVLSKLKQR